MYAFFSIWDSWQSVIRFTEISTFILTKMSPHGPKSRLLEPCRLQSEWKWTFQTVKDSSGFQQLLFSGRGQIIWNDSVGDASHGSRSLLTPGAESAPEGIHLFFLLSDAYVSDSQHWKSIYRLCWSCSTCGLCVCRWGWDLRLMLSRIFL